MHRLRVLGEVEPGLPFAVADDWVRPLPVITKAGAFGSSQALVSCREFLRQLGRVPCRANAEDSLLNHKS
jgi:4-hydroxythreonine-4-phosphate dehydrogenase